MTQEQAIKEMQFLIDGYEDLTGWGANKECLRLKEACKMAKVALEDWRATGRWIHSTKSDGVTFSKCSKCNQFNYWGDVNYCPWCGAKMKDERR